MLIDFDRRPTDQDTSPVIEMQGVSVRYRLAQERIPSIKEYAIRRLKGQIRYQTFLALDKIDLLVMPGEVFGIIGPNGAGKSTLLKVIARVLHPTNGRIRLRGRLAPLLELGAGFDFELTGRENIFLNGAILGFSQRDLEKRVDRIIDFAGLKEFIDLPLRTYSTGMVARLGFSVATDVRPEILIVDEILSVGDAEFQTRSFERIQGFQAQGTTILLVSHSLGNIEEMCSRVLWLDHGRIIALGSAKSVVDRYLGRVRDEEGERLSQEAEKEPVDRWGNRRIEITGVRIADLDGNEQLVFQTGQPLVLHLEYEAHEPTLSPNFGIAIHRQDGVHITGPNIAFAGMDLGIVEGRGALTYTIPGLPLLDGLYHFSVAVVDSQDQEIMDYHDRTYSFRVSNRDSAIQEKYGLLTLGGAWCDLRNDDG